MAKKSETQKLQQYADSIWSRCEYSIWHVAGKGYMLRDNDGSQRLLGRNANEAHAELDAMADLMKAQMQAENAYRGL